MKPIDLIEAMSSCPTVRRFRQDPVEDEKVAAALSAANYAPSGENSQPWDFIIIKNQTAKRQIGDCAVKGLRILQRVRTRRALTPSMRKTQRRAAALADETEHIPLLILVCLDTKRAMGDARVNRLEIFKTLRRLPQLRRLRDLTVYGSVFPAVQNLILAARGLGLGTSISLAPLIFEREIKQLLGIPRRVKLVAVLYVGYPAGRFVTPKRLPAEQLTHFEHW